MVLRRTALLRGGITSISLRFVPEKAKRGGPLDRTKIGGLLKFKVAWPVLVVDGKRQAGAPFDLKGNKLSRDIRKRTMGGISKALGSIGFGKKRPSPRSAVWSWRCALPARAASAGGSSAYRRPAGRQDEARCAEPAPAASRRLSRDGHGQSRVERSGAPRDARPRRCAAEGLRNRARPRLLPDQGHRRARPGQGQAGTPLGHAASLPRDAQRPDGWGAQFGFPTWSRPAGPRWRRSVRDQDGGLAEQDVDGPSPQY